MERKLKSWLKKKERSFDIKRKQKPEWLKFKKKKFNKKNEKKTTIYESNSRKKENVWQKRKKKTLRDWSSRKKKRVIKVKESKNLWVEFMNPNGFHNSDFLSRLPGKKKV